MFEKKKWKNVPENSKGLFGKSTFTKKENAFRKMHFSERDDRSSLSEKCTGNMG